MADNDLKIYAVGDVIINRPDWAERWDTIVPSFAAADIRYCNAEQVLSDRGTAVDPSCLPWRMNPDYARAYGYAKFDVASTNGNHQMEWGPEAMLHTNELIQAGGVLTCGSGANIAEARKPAVVERKGVKVAFLAYNSIIAFAEEALTGWPGMAPMRVDTFYHQIEHNQPAGPGRTRSFADREDLAEMRKDVRKAKAENDIVMVALHWGIHYVRAEMAEYQFQVAHAAIDEGADVILGCHPHLLKAFEVYKGKPIFHSLGQFQADPLNPGALPGLPPPTPRPNYGRPRKSQQLSEVHALRRPDPEYPLIGGTRPGDIVNTGIAKLYIDPSTKQLTRAAFTPMLAHPEEGFLVRKVDVGSPDWDRLVEYVRDVTVKGGVETRFEVEGDEIVMPLDQ